MGIYVNPPDQTKEEFLQRHGIEVDFVNGSLTVDDIWDEERQLDELPVVLMQNPQFSAAGIAYSREELESFLDPTDDRPKKVYLVRIDKLEGTCPMEALKGEMDRCGTEYITETPLPGELPDSPESA